MSAPGTGVPKRDRAAYDGVVLRRRLWDSGGRSARLRLCCAVLLLSCCSAKPVAPLQLDAGRLTVTNTSADDWNKVEIWINRQYRLTVESIPAGQRLQTPLGIFVEGYGRRFDFARQQINDLRLSAKTNDGKPVDVRMDLKGNGLAGLAGVGVFKDQNSKEEK
jgi:hypothetical protein